MRRSLIAIAVASLLTVALCALIWCDRWSFRLLPPWYALPFYTIARSIPSKTTAMLSAVGGIFGMFILPWTLASEGKHKFRSPIFSFLLALFVGSFITMFICGLHEVEDPVFGERPDTFGNLEPGLNSYLWLGRAVTLYYFGFMLLAVPMWRRAKSADMVDIFS